MDLFPYSHLTTLLVLILLLVKDNDFPTEMRAFNIKAKKRDLGKAKREIRKKVAELKEVMTLQGQIFKLD